MHSDFGHLRIWGALFLIRAAVHFGKSRKKSCGFAPQFMLLKDGTVFAKNLVMAEKAMQLLLFPRIEMKMAAMDFPWVHRIQNMTNRRET